jgi:hypothetical protein
VARDYTTGGKAVSPDIERFPKAARLGSANDCPSALDRNAREDEPLGVPDASLANASIPGDDSSTGIKVSRDGSADVRLPLTVSNPNHYRSPRLRCREPLELKKDLCVIREQDQVRVAVGRRKVRTAVELALADDLAGSSGTTRCSVRAEDGDCQSEEPDPRAAAHLVHS